MGLGKAALIDTSSAILLYKTGWMAPLLKVYRIGAGPAVWQELTVAHYPGARAFTRWHRENRITIHRQPEESPGTAGGPYRLGPGEEECIALYHQGAGAFIIVDDGPAAAFCRREKIPYVNALLIPRLLSPDGAADDPEVVAAMQKISAIGRYASWVRTYAFNCPSEDLAFFRPKKAAD